MEQGLVDALVQRKDIGPQHLDTAFWANLAIGALISVLVFIGAEEIATLFGEPGTTRIIQWLAPSFAIAGMAAVQRSIMLRDLRFRELAFRTMASLILAGAVGVVMALRGFGAYALVGQFLANRVADAVLLWRMTDWRPRWSFSWGRLRELWAFGGNIMGLNLTTFANQRADNLVVGYFLGATALGYYVVAYRLFTALTALTVNSINPVLLGVLSRFQAAPERLRSAYYRVTRVVAAAGIPVFVGLAMLAPQIVVVLFGERWLPSVMVVRVFAAIGALMTILGPGPAMVKAIGRPGVLLGLNVFNGIANLAAITFAVRWGIVGVAVAFVARAYLVAPLTLYVVRRESGISVRRMLLGVAPAILNSVAMAAGVLALLAALPTDTGPAVQLAVGVAAGAALYALGAWLFLYTAVNDVKEILRPTAGRDPAWSEPVPRSMRGS